MSDCRLPCCGHESQELVTVNQRLDSSTLSMVASKHPAMMSQMIDLLKVCSSAVSLIDCLSACLSPHVSVSLCLCLCLFGCLSQQIWRACDWLSCCSSMIFFLEGLMPLLVFAFFFFFFFFFFSVLFLSFCCHLFFLQSGAEADVSAPASA